MFSGNWNFYLNNLVFLNYDILYVYYFIYIKPLVGLNIDFNLYLNYQVYHNYLISLDLYTPKGVVMQNYDVFLNAGKTETYTVFSHFIEFLYYWNIINYAKALFLCNLSISIQYILLYFMVLIFVFSYLTISSLFVKWLYIVWKYSLFEKVIYNYIYRLKIIVKLHHEWTHIQLKEKNLLDIESKKVLWEDKYDYWNQAYNLMLLMFIWRIWVRMFMAFIVALVYVPLRLVLHYTYKYNIYANFFFTTIYWIFQSYLWLNLKWNKKTQEFLLYRVWYCVIKFKNICLKYMFLERNLFVLRYFQDVVLWFTPKFFKRATYLKPLTSNYLLLWSRKFVNFFGKKLLKTSFSTGFYLWFPLILVLKWDLFRDNPELNLKWIQYRVYFMRKLLYYEVTYNFRKCLLILLILMFKKLLILVFLFIVYVYFFHWSLDRFLIFWLNIGNMSIKLIFYILYGVFFYIKEIIKLSLKIFFTILLYFKWIWLLCFLYYLGIDFNFLGFFLYQISLDDPIAFFLSQSIAIIIDTFYSYFGWIFYTDLYFVNQVDQYFVQLKLLNKSLDVSEKDYYEAKEAFFNQGFIYLILYMLFFFSDFWADLLIFLDIAFIYYYKYFVINWMGGPAFCLINHKFFPYWFAYLGFNIVSEIKFLFTFFFSYTWFYYVPYNFFQHSLFIIFIYRILGCWFAFKYYSIWIFIFVYYVYYIYYTMLKLGYIIIYACINWFTIIILWIDCCKEGLVYEKNNLEQFNYYIPFNSSIMDYVVQFRDWILIRFGFSYNDLSIYFYKTQDFFMFELYIPPKEIFDPYNKTGLIDADEELLGVYGIGSLYYHTNWISYLYSNNPYYKYNGKFVISNLDEVLMYANFSDSFRIHCLYQLVSFISLIIFVYTNAIWFKKENKYTSYNPWFIWKLLRLNSIKDTYSWLNKNKVSNLIRLYVEEHLAEEEINNKSLSLYITFIENLIKKLYVLASNENAVQNFMSLIDKEFGIFYQNLTKEDRKNLNKFEEEGYGYKILESALFNYVDFLHKEQYTSYFDVRGKNSIKLSLFLGLGNKKNEYLKALFYRHVDVMLIKEEVRNKKKAQISYNFFYKCVDLFYILDKELFNFKGPQFMFHKDSGVPFVAKEKKNNKITYLVAQGTPELNDNLCICLVAIWFFVKLSFDFFSGLHEAEGIELLDQNYDWNSFLFHTILTSAWFSKYIVLSSWFSTAFEVSRVTLNSPWVGLMNMQWWNPNTMWFIDPLSWNIKVSVYYLNNDGLWDPIWALIGVYKLELHDYIFQSPVGSMELQVLYWFKWIFVINILLVIKLFKFRICKKVKIKKKSYDKLALLCDVYNYYEIYKKRWIYYFKRYGFNNKA